MIGVANMAVGVFLSITANALDRSSDRGLEAYITMSFSSHSYPSTYAAINCPLDKREISVSVTNISLGGGFGVGEAG